MEDKKGFVDFSYQSHGKGRIRKFICNCGKEIKSERNKDIESGDRVTCPHCGLTHEYQWEGFRIYQVGYPKGQKATEQ